MGSELEDVRLRRAALAVRAGAIEGLPAMMDRDLADIKQRMDAQDHLLQALHLTQANRTQRLTRIEDGLGSVDAALARVEADFRGKLDTAVAMLGRLLPPEDGQP
jgi:hypothetical protein